MDVIVDDNVDPKDLKKAELAYEDQAKVGKVSAQIAFDYALCLIRSERSHHRKRGIAMMEDLYQVTNDERAKRDYLFYVAVGCTRTKDYDLAKRYCGGILAVEPQNHQTQQLLDLIEKRMRRDGLLGMAAVGAGAALVVGGITALGLALSKK